MGRDRRVWSQQRLIVGVPLKNDALFAEGLLERLQIDRDQSAVLADAFGGVSGP